MADGFEGFIGYIKYDGLLVQHGVMDARKQAEALLGFDSAIRYFLIKLSPEFKGFEFEIPVKVREGSWEALIPETISGWVQASFGVVATAYFTQAAQKMAEKDFEDFGITDIFKKALQAIKWFVRIGKHVGDLGIKNFKEVRFVGDNSLVGIRNEQGGYIYVPKYILDIYAESSSGVMGAMAGIVEVGRTLKIGSVDDGVVDEVVIDFADKHIFCRDEVSEESILFPELKHGDVVVLEGEVTRENKTSNSMGFKYLDHILTSYPSSGSIVRYKQLLFLRCRLFGTVDRTDDAGFALAKRPRLHFSNLEALEQMVVRDLFS
jgi:hypothetical protein